MSKSIISQYKSGQHFFRDREAYPKEVCRYIEDIISVGSTMLEETGGNGRLRFVDDQGKMITQLTVAEGKSHISSEDNVIVLVKCIGDKISSYAFFGSESDVDFKSNKDEFCLDDNGKVEALKSFITSWKIIRGKVSATVVVVDKYKVFEKIIKDVSFEDCYVFLAE